MLPHIYMIFIVDRLDYLEQGNRLGAAQSLLGSMLRIKPLLLVEDGQIIPVEKMRTQTMALEKLSDFVGEFASVQEIYQQVQTDFPMTSLATVYKTIALLKEMGQVLELGFSDDSSRYDGRQPFPHPHLICVRCSSVTDWEIGQSDIWTQQVAQESGYQMLGYRLDLLGICPHCQQEKH